mmetsp:Transcript_1726/g.3356  ORF Transcript_1726/g.3356 Transcript_1726/m.3356 type:complete len:81 (+) Transcript_1726:1393-1635(+)
MLSEERRYFTQGFKSRTKMLQPLIQTNSLGVSLFLCVADHRRSPSSSSDLELRSIRGVYHFGSKVFGLVLRMGLAVRGPR